MGLPAEKRPGVVWLTGGLSGAAVLWQSHGSCLGYRVVSFAIVNTTLLLYCIICGSLLCIGTLFSFCIGSFCLVRNGLVCHVFCLQYDDVELSPGNVDHVLLPCLVLSWLMSALG